MLKKIRDCLSLLDCTSHKQFFLVGVLILGSAMLETISVALVFPLLKFIIDPGTAETLPFISNFLGSLAETEGTGRLILIVAIGFFGIISVKNILLIAMYYWQSRIVFENEWKVSRNLFGAYLRGPYVFTMGRNSAELIRNVNEAVRETFQGVLYGLISFATECIIVLAIGAVLIAFSPLAAICAATVLGAGLLIFNKIFLKKFEAWGAQSMMLKKALYQSIQEGLHGLKTTKVHGREQYFQDAFSRTKAKMFRLGLVTNTVNQTPRLWVETLILLTMVLIIAVVIDTRENDVDIFATLGLFATAAFRLMPSINRLSISVNNIRRGTAALESILEDTQQLSMYLDAAPVRKDTEELGTIKTIHLDRLGFIYPKSDKPVIKDISFEIKRNQSIGLVGPSGSGKTTIVDILLGLLEASSGQVLINGHDESAVRQAWHGRLGYVPQSVYVLDDTLRRNIAYGFPDADINDERVWEAIRLAQLEDFITNLPNGLDTFLGEHGVRLSGGQRQRIGIARALYHDPEVLVFDEATSALDSETELAIAKALQTLHGEKTMILIAHRLSTVRECDRLIFLEEGRVSDSGTFEELTENNATFRNLVEISRL